MKAFSTYLIAAWNNVSKGNRPNLLDNSSHPDTAPGTVTESQPVMDIFLYFLIKYSKFHDFGDFPDAFNPYNFLDLLSQIMAKASPPIPLLVHSTTVRVMATAMAAFAAKNRENPNYNLTIYITSF